MENQKMGQNTLKEFGTTFQSKCISALVTDRIFLERIADILLPEFFETDAHRWIVNLVKEYFPQYKDVPTMDVFKVEINAIQDVVLQAAVFDQVKQAYKPIATTDSEYIKDKFVDFCKNQKLKSAIYEASILLKSADYDGIWKLINDASKAGAERNIGHDYFADFDARMSEAARETIKTGWEIIDGHLDGGLGKGELGFIVAPAGSGKSWFLTSLGVAALRQGKNVMHFTMELNEKYVGRRYDACFSEIAFQDVRKYQAQIKDSHMGVDGKLYIKYFPMNTASSLTLKAHIERTQLMTQKKIDLVIVDYADLLRPFTIQKNSNSYEQGGDTYGELRGMLGELQVPGWSASQANRGAHEEEIVGALNVADSYKKIMIGDFIMSLARKTEDKIASTGRVSILKSRFGSDGPVYPTAFDTSCGKINIYDAKSVEGAEILKKSKDQAENVKDIISKAWDKTHKKDDQEESF
jgi:replicative DNA helicase